MELIKKFRGQQKDTNIWVYGNAIQCAGIWYIYNENESFRTPQDPDFENSFIEIIPETMGQFTGFYDKNGKEIYEGDILKSNYKDYIYWVVFEKGGFHIYNDFGRYNSIERCFEILKEINIEIEIIGNIHERLAQLPKNPMTPKSANRVKYLSDIAMLFGITKQKPFNGKFYFEIFPKLKKELNQ